MILYGPTAYASKLCLLWIMARIFHPLRKYVCPIYLLMALMSSYYMVITMVKIWACDPIKTYWDNRTAGRCLNIESVIITDAIVSVVSDLLILILPCFLTARLSIPKANRMKVASMMGAGGLAILASLARLIVIVLTRENDLVFSAAVTNVLAWVLSLIMSLPRLLICCNRTIEITFGFICGCLPSFSLLVSNSLVGKAKRKDITENGPVELEEDTQTPSNLEGNQLNGRNFDHWELAWASNGSGNSCGAESVANTQRLSCDRLGILKTTEVEVFARSAH